jgi:hypothetical protein
MRKRVQTGHGCVIVNSETHSIRAAVASRDKREHVAGLLAHERQLREEIAHAGELMAHDADRDARETTERFEV